eukprot:620448-Pleurochrysis_carterae.AAC.2
MLFSLVARNAATHAAVANAVGAQVLLPAKELISASQIVVTRSSRIRNPLAWSGFLDVKPARSDNTQSSAQPPTAVKSSCCEKPGCGRSSRIQVLRMSISRVYSYSHACVLAWLIRCIQGRPGPYLRYAGSSALIHCYMGASRAASVATAYVMMTQQRYDLDEALAFVKLRRAAIGPNWGFRQQLRRSFITTQRKLLSDRSMLLLLSESGVPPSPSKIASYHATWPSHHYAHSTRF